MQLSIFNIIIKIKLILKTNMVKNKNIKIKFLKKLKQKNIPALFQGRVRI